MPDTLIIPNTTTGEFCPDWPDICICPIEPPHHPLSPFQADCGHCSDHKVTVPRPPLTTDEPSLRDLLLAAHYCANCNTVLCNNCGEQDQNQPHCDCASAT